MQNRFKSKLISSFNEIIFILVLWVIGIQVLTYAFEHTILQDIINFEKFTSQMTNDEKQQLVQYLPPTDNVQSPDRFVINPLL